MSNPDLSIVIPTYSRPEELSELLDSVLGQTVAPREVVVSADLSPRQVEIIEVSESRREELRRRGTTLRVIKNTVNLGFDKNLRQAIENSSSSWAMVMGDDDLLLPSAVDVVAQRQALPQRYNFYSRSFVRFEGGSNRELGVSKLASSDGAFTRDNAPPRTIFKSSRFISGLVVDVDFARTISTDDFDGLLYYQVFLAAESYCSTGIGYISEPLVSGRTDNPPLFGEAADEAGVFVPGSYSPSARLRMWEGVLRIAGQVGRDREIDLETDLRRELGGRESFHVFEMNAGASRRDLDELRAGLRALGLYTQVTPKLLFLINLLFGRRARFFYSTARRLLQR